MQKRAGGCKDTVPIRVKVLGATQFSIMSQWLALFHEVPETVAPVRLLAAIHQEGIACHGAARQNLLTC